MEVSLCAPVTLQMVKMKQRLSNGSTDDPKKHLNGTTVASINEQLTTDIHRWRLRDEAGQQTWHYLASDEEVKAWPQSAADRYFLGLPLVSIIPPPCSHQCH